MRPEDGGAPAEAAQSRAGREGAGLSDEAGEGARGSAPREASTLTVILLYAAIAAVVIPVYPHFVSPNEFSRWALTVSLAERGSVEVGELLPLLGSRLEDLSEVDGRVFANKAPGVSIVAVPAYAAARLATGPPSARSMRPTLYLMRWGAATMPLMLLALAVARLARRFGIERERTALVVAQLLFATPLFAYGLLFFAHALVAACLFGAWVALFVSERTGPGAPLAAGALLGLAVMSEYTAAIPATVLVLLALEARRPWRAALVVAGGLPFAVALGLYHRAAFGGFLELPTGHERLAEFRELAGSGLFGVGLPMPGTLLQILFDPGKGLLVLSPFLILLVSALRGARAALPRRSWWALCVTPAAILLLHAGYGNWHGGWTVGVRYLVPALPFLVFPFLFRKITPSELLLFGASVAFVVPTSLVFPFVPNGFAMPWITFAAPLAADGLVAPNLFHLIARPLAVAIPPVLALLAIARAVSLRRFALVTAGAALGWTLSAVLAASPQPPAARIQRAYIEEVYFERQGTMEQEFPGSTLPRRLVERRNAEIRLPPPSWPF